MINKTFYTLEEYLEKLNVERDIIIKQFYNKEFNEIQLLEKLRETHDKELYVINEKILYNEKNKENK